MPPMNTSERSIKAATPQLTMRSERRIWTKPLSPHRTRWLRNPYRSRQSPGIKQILVPSPRQLMLLENPLTQRFGKRLSRSIHSTEKPAQVTRHCQNCYCQSLDWQAVSGQNCSLVALRFRVDEPHDPDQQARCTAKHQMHQKDAFEPLPFELPLPRDNSGD